MILYRWAHRALTLMALLILTHCIATPKNNAPIASNEASSSQRELASEQENDFPLLNYEQIENLDAKTVYDFYQKTYKLLEQMEVVQSRAANNELFPQKNKGASLLQWINESFADSRDPKLGNECLIGGFWGTWQKKSSGKGSFRVTCDSPHRCHLPTDKAGVNSGHACNHEYFTYFNAANRTEFCADLKKDLTQSGCVHVVERFYKEMGKATFADHFRRSLLNSIAADAKLKNISPKEAVRRKKAEVRAEYKHIQDYCGTTPEEWNRLKAGQNYSCFKLLSMYSDIEQTFANIEQHHPKYKTPRPVRQAQVPRPVPRGMGPFACMKAGLAQAGYPQASNKFIAAIALANKYKEDSYVAETPQARQEYFLKSTIMTLAALGPCDSTNYEFQNEQEAAMVEQWLTTEKYSETNGYQQIFQTRIGNMSFPQWSYPAIKQRDFAYRNKGTALAQCRNTPQTGLEVQNLCQAMSLSCGLDTVGCGFGLHITSQKDLAYSQKQQPNDGGNPGRSPEGSAVEY